MTREYGKKLSHEEVDYGPGHEDAHCGICEHFIKRGPHCEKVVDPIAWPMWCKKYEDKE